jgi:hypothetical protein
MVGSSGRPSPLRPPEAAFGYAAREQGRKRGESEPWHGVGRSEAASDLIYFCRRRGLSGSIEHCVGAVEKEQCGRERKKEEAKW